MQKNKSGIITPAISLWNFLQTFFIEIQLFEFQRVDSKINS